MRKSFLIPTIVFGVLVFVLPHFTHAAISTNNLGPVLQSTQGSGNNICGCNGQGTAPDFGCILGIAENLLSIFVSFSILLVTIYIAWAGITYMLNPTSPEARTKANKRIINAVLGLLIVLCSWLLVDTVMKVLYNSSAQAGTVQLGPWNSILSPTNTNLCLQKQSGTGLPPIINNGNAGGGTTGVVGGAGKGGTAQCAPGNSACSVQALESQGLNQKQAQAMSCIAMSESSGIPSQYNSASGACGTFEILSGHQSSTWNNPAYHTGSCSVNTPCTNASCNLQTAVIMFNKSAAAGHGGYSDWICPGCNATAHACVANFDPGHGE